MHTFQRCVSRECRSTLLWQGGWAVSGGATGLHFLLVSLWKAETELGLLTDINGGGGGSGSEFTMMAAVCFMNVSHTHSHTLSITDKRPCQTPPASSTPVQIHVETNIFNLFLIYKKKKNSWQCIYFYFSYCQQSNQ